VDNGSVREADERGLLVDLGTVDRQHRLGDVFAGVEPGVERRPEVDLYTQPVDLLEQVEPELDRERARGLRPQIGDLENRPAELPGRLEPVLGKRVAAGAFERDGEPRDRRVDDRPEPQSVALDPESSW
jgi:hypothetical protein